MMSGVRISRLKGTSAISSNYTITMQRHLLAPEPTDREGLSLVVVVPLSLIVVVVVIVPSLVAAPLPHWPFGVRRRRRTEIPLAVGSRGPDRRGGI